MRDYVIVTDSACDLGKEIREKYQIDYVKMNIVVANKELPASLDWDVYSPKEMYDWMRKGTIVKTTQVLVSEYLDVFTKHLEEGKDILYLACSSALSGSINTALTIKEELEPKYPDAKIICIDTLISCLGEGMIAVKAAVLKESGKSIEEVASYIEKNKLKYNQLATVESLEYLKKAGRIKASAAFFGNIFGVKPIIISDVKGQNYAVKKVKGRRNSLLELINIAKELIEDPTEQVVCVGHADCMIDAEFLKEHLLTMLKCKEVYINYIGPIIGASVGPGTVGIYFVGKEVTIIGE